MDPKFIAGQCWSLIKSAIRLSHIWHASPQFAFSSDHGQNAAVVCVNKSKLLLLLFKTNWNCCCCCFIIDNKLKLLLLLFKPNWNCCCCCFIIANKMKLLLLLFKTNWNCCCCCFIIENYFKLFGKREIANNSSISARHFLSETLLWCGTLPQTLALGQIPAFV